MIFYLLPEYISHFRAELLHGKHENSFPPLLVTVLLSKIEEKAAEPKYVFHPTKMD